LSSGFGIGSYTVDMTDLSANTTYYVRAYAVNSAGTSYGDEVSFATYPDNYPIGAINGVFSVSATQQVYFSRGNLQYKATTNQWRFAENQYDFVGLDNTYISPDYSGWIDLFAWGASGFDHGSVYYQPWSTEISDSLYNAYGNPYYDLGDETGQADWGYNAIINGGNQTGFWHTLTLDEWSYVFNTRNTTSGIRYAKAIVNNVKGTLLLPDDWSASNYTLYNVNNSSCHFSDNVISISDWNIMEAQGAVFLPSAGSRYVELVSGYSQPNNSSSYGQYWSSTHYDYDGAYFVRFNNSVLITTYNQVRFMGQSVRVVCPVQR